MRARARPGLSFQTWLRFADDVGGATSIEYAMIACGIAVAIAAVVTKLGSTTNTSFTNLSTLLR